MIYIKILRQERIEKVCDHDNWNRLRLSLGTSHWGSKEPKMMDLYGWWCVRFPWPHRRETWGTPFQHLFSLLFPILFFFMLVGIGIRSRMNISFSGRSISWIQRSYVILQNLERTDSLLVPDWYWCWNILHLDTSGGS